MLIGCKSKHIIRASVPLQSYCRLLVERLFLSFMYESIFQCLVVNGWSEVSPSCKGCFRFKARGDNFDSSAKADCAYSLEYVLTILRTDCLTAQRTLVKLLFLFILFEIFPHARFRIRCAAFARHCV